MMQEKSVKTVNNTQSSRTHDQGSSSETPLFSSKKTSNSNIATRPNLTIGLEGDSAPKIVEDEGLVGLSETELPRKTSVLDSGPSRSSSSSVVSRDEDVIRLRLRHSRSDDSDSDFGNELDGDSSAGIGTLEVVDELLEILDGVNIVVRGRGDESYSGSGVTGASNGGRNLVTGEFSSFSGLRSLGHLDLKFIRVGEVVGGDSET